MWVPPFNYYDNTWLLNSDGSIKEINQGGRITDHSMGVGGYVHKNDLLNLSIPSYVTVGEKIGIPYAWGGSTPINSWGLYVGPSNDFDVRLEEGLPPGNLNTNLNSDAYFTTGVDCEGFIEVVWRLGTRYGMDIAQQATRPVRLAELKPGDVLMSYTNGQERNSHIILFKEFINYTYDPNTPPTDQTQFIAYEASYSAGKVIEKTYQFSNVVLMDANHPTDTVKLNNVDGSAADGAPVSSGPQVYVPRTYLNPISVIFIFDNSSSITAPELSEAKLAALGALISMRPGDKVGVTSFNTNSLIRMPLTEIQDETQINQAITAINSVSIAGGTTINAGLGSGYEQLISVIGGLAYAPGQLPPTPPVTPIYLPGQAMVFLMSDGQTNENLESILTYYQTANIPVHTLGIGPNINYNLLRYISTKTHGIFGYSQNWGAFKGSVASLLSVVKIKNTSDTFVELKAGSGQSGDTVEETVQVDSTMGTMTVAFVKSNSNIILSLVKPDGTAIPPTAVGNSNITYFSDPTYEGYIIHSPQPGVWKMNIAFQAAGEYTASISTWAAMTLSVDTDKDEYRGGEPIKLTAAIKESGGMGGPEYIYGSVIHVTAQNPSNTQSTFDLYDDGQHDDGEANDGFYANVYANTPLDGDYNFKVQVYGNNIRDDQPFTREELLSVYVKLPPTVVSSVRASLNPTSYYNVNYTVTFSEPVTGVDISDFTLTTDGINGAAISGVSGSDNIYTVTIKTGIGSGTIRLDVVDNDTIIDADADVLGGTGLHNGNFTSGDSYDKTTGTIVSKLADTNDGNCDTDCSIQEAIASAAPGDTVTFDTELAGETIHLVSPLTLSRDITIDGSDLVEPVVISGDTDNNGTGDVQVLKVNSGVITNLNSLIILKGKSINAGGGIHNNGLLTITNSTVSSNSGSYGGGIYNGGTLTITNSNVSSNSATLFGGGGIHNAGTLTITNSTISNNSASTVSGYGGGGIYNRGTLSMMDSTLFNNSVSSMGGGIYNYDYGTTSITNSTLSSNSAGTAGGGIYNTGSLTLINDTFSNGSAPSGGGIVNGGSKILNYSNTIIANSMSGGDCINNGALGTNTQNLVEDGSCSAILSGDPNLGSLADNGGSTKTIALLSGSSAIDAGDITTCANAPVNNLDQRGVTRPQGGQCDIGAYEGYIDPATMPVVDTFTAVSFSANLNISITEFTASDDEGVTGYLITQSLVPPSANDAGWSGTPPTIYTVSAEATYTLYPWVKDASSYISSAFTLPITVTVSLPTATPTMTSTPTQTPLPTETLTATPTATPYPNILADEFDNPTLSAYWEWYVPKAGPTYSLSAVPGSLRMNLPAGDSFEHWGDINNSPQLRLKNFGAGDWAIETRLENVDAAAEAGYWASLEVGFAGSDQIWFGMVDDDYLKSFRLSEGEYFAVGAGLPITLRLEKVGEAYTFKYKYDSDLTWTVMPVINSVGTPTYVGLIGRGIWTGSTEMHMDWSYFRAENWSAATPTPVIPTLTSTPTGTPTETPTSTPTFTPTATDTPTSTPTDTPTSTPTDTSTPTVTHTPTNTLTFTPTAPPSDTGTPTHTPTVTNTPAPVGSGWVSPAANAAVTSGSGDNNGFQTNPANANSDNTSFAVDTNSGTNTNTACNNSGKDRHIFYTYNFSSIPSGSTILGIEVRLDMKADSATGTPKSCIELSWNGGTTWTAAKTSTTFTTTEATYILGSGTDTWGRAWTTNELSNFRVRITNVSSNNSRDFSLDWIPVRISYLPPAPTPTFTFTPSPSFTPTSTHTLTPTATYTPTSTPTNTHTPTATPTQTDAPNATNTATITATQQPGVILDEFNNMLLNPDWEWYVPLVGPNYSLDAEPGKLQLVVQSSKDHWVDLDESPQLRRSDMGNGDWTIETYLALDDSNAGDAWQVNLVAGFGRYDQQWLSIDSGNELHVRRVGDENDTALVGEISLPLYLRMERTGTDYTFKYKELLGDPWITLDVQSINDPVAYVGVQFRTFSSSSGDAVFNMDYFRMEQSNPPDLGPVKEIEMDDFDGQSLNGDWTWYVPKSGPTYSLSTVPGSFRMSLPAFESFEHWGEVDEAPQLRRSDLGSGDWAIETQLENIDATDAGYWAALEVGFDQFDQIWYGMADDGYLKAYRLSEGEYAAMGQNLPLILRLEKHGEEYIFKYRQDPNEAWTALAPKTYVGTPSYVGLIGRGFNTGSTGMQIDWSYFRLERWTPVTQITAPQSLNNTQGILEAEGQGKQDRGPKSTPTPSPTEITNPSPTPIPTPTVTPRSTHVVSPTPTLTPIRP